MKSLELRINSCYFLNIELNQDKPYFQLGSFEF